MLAKRRKPSDLLADDLKSALHARSCRTAFDMVQDFRDVVASAGGRWFESSPP
jgi:hypothetical protein